MFLTLIIVCFGAGLSVGLLCGEIRKLCQDRRDKKQLTCNENAVVVTSATHSAPAGYTATQMTAGATIPAFSTPYPAQGIPSHMPMHAGQTQAPGFQHNATDFSTMSPANLNPPPSYDVAVSSTIVNEKQVP